MRTRLAIGTALLATVVGQATALTQQNQITFETQQKLQAIAQQRLAIQQIEANRLAVVVEIVAQWTPTAAARGYTGDWSTELQGVLMRLPAAKLLEIRQAKSYDEVVAIALGHTPRFTVTTADAAAAANAATAGAANAPTSGPEPAALGDLNADLVFTPVLPCRIIDTRVAGGALTAGTPRIFRVNGDMSSQGGDASGCLIPVDPAAVAITLTVTEVAGPGNLRAWPYNASDTTAPLASVINYSTADVANTTVVQICQLCGPDLYIRADVSATHLVADIVGYFRQPAAAALDVVDVVSAESVPPGSPSTLTPTCPAGRSVSGGGLDVTGAASNVWIWGNGPDSTNNRWSCRLLNSSAGTVVATCTARCARIPGYGG